MGERMKRRQFLKVLTTLLGKDTRHISHHANGCRKLIDSPCPPFLPLFEGYKVFFQNGAYVDL